MKKTTSSALEPISKIVGRRSRLLYLLMCSTQVGVMIAVVAFLTFRDAKKRSEFLFKSNDKSLGLMLSTGDRFQIKTTVSSFVTEETVGVAVIDEQDQIVVEKSIIDSALFTDKKNIFLVKNFNVFLRTEHEIIFNDHSYGRLILFNKLRLYEWLLMCGIFLSLVMIFFYFQSKMQEATSQEIGRHIRNLGDFFDHYENRSRLETYYEKRERSKYLEIENLASKIKTMLVKILDAVTLEKQAAIGRITSHLTHDLRAPLGVFERLLITPDDQMSSLKPSVKESLNRLYSMVDALRNSESEQIIQRQKSKLDFGFGIETLLLRAKINNVELTVTSTLHESVFIDLNKVERAWINLTSNALDFTKSFVKIDSARIGSTLVIRVTDDGPGIPSEFLPKLFQRGATSGKYGGTGLGLAYVKQVVQGHGGDVRYFRENDLTIFECTIPNSFIEEKTEQYLESPMRNEETQHISPKEIVSICFSSALLSQKVFERLNAISIESYYFVEGIHDSAGIVISDDSEVLEKAFDSGKRVVSFDESMSDEEIIRRCPTRLGLRG